MAIASILGSKPAYGAGNTANIAAPGVSISSGAGIAYSKRIVCDLPLQFPDWDASASMFGHKIFPQAFTIDGKANEVLVVYGGNKTVVVTYDWTSGTYKGAFVVESAAEGNGNHAGSEGAEIIYSGSVRYLYLAIGSGRIARFDITKRPAKLATVAPQQTWNTGSKAKFFFAGSHWFAAHGYPHGELTVMNQSFERIGTTSISPGIHGGWSDTTRLGQSHPKIQSIQAFKGLILGNLGGHHSASTASRPYGYQGIRAFTPSGHIVVDALMDPVKMVSILKEHLRDIPSKIEAEGISVHDGNLYTLTVTQGWGVSAAARRGGLVFFEEFSTHNEAIDFSGAATLSSAPDYRAHQGGISPVGPDTKLRHQGTGEELTGLPAIANMMVETGATTYNFSTSGLSVSDAKQKALPKDTVVMLVQVSNNQIHVRYSINDNVHVLKKSGATWSQSSKHDTGSLPLKIASGVAAYSPSYRLHNGEVSVDGAVKLTGLAAGLFHRVAQLPAGFRPVKYQYYPARAAGSKALADIRVTQDGWIEAMVSIKTSASVTLSGIRYHTG